MILVGAGGLAKSRSVRAVLSDGEACWIEGNATPFGMYAKLYRHRDQFVVIDDVDALYADRSGVRPATFTIQKTGMPPPPYVAASRRSSVTSHRTTSTTRATSSGPGW